jgi:exodeoxyribonuclease VII small subunit
MNEEHFSYKAALAEIESIVQQIEKEALDVDELNEKVKRAMFLLKICKDRLKNTEEELNRNLEELL